MSKFMFVLIEDPRKNQSYTPEQMQKLIEEYGAWAEKLAQEGRLLGGNKLKEEGGKVVKSDGRQVAVLDGPFIEAKEVVAGFFLIQAEGYDQAVAIARSCPHVRHGLRIEIRALDPVCEAASSRREMLAR